MKLVPIIFSTITGNAFKLADAVKDVVKDHCGPYNIRYVNDEMIDTFDTFILSYWCDKGSLDPDTIELIGKMKNKKLIVIGTLGADTKGRHYEDVCRSAEEIASSQNTLLGHFLCQGSIDLKRTGKKLREGRLSEERFEKQKLSLNHPNEEDFENARKAVKSFLDSDEG